MSLDELLDAFHEAVLDVEREHHPTTEDRAKIPAARKAIVDALSDVTAKVREIHEVMKRGKATGDHGLDGNLACILDSICSRKEAAAERTEQIGRLELVNADLDTQVKAAEAYAVALTSQARNVVYFWRRLYSHIEGVKGSLLETSVDGLESLLNRESEIGTGSGIAIPPIGSSPGARMANYPRSRDEVDRFKVVETSAGPVSVDTQWQCRVENPVFPLSDNLIQEVPDKCDRIVWRNRYYHLESLERGLPTETPIGWYDHFNDEFIRATDDAQKARTGGNKLSPVYFRSENSQWHADPADHLDAMRWQKLCGLMAYGDFVIHEVPDNAEVVEFDYIHELEAAVDAADALHAKFGHESDERQRKELQP